MMDRQMDGWMYGWIDGQKEAREKQYVSRPFQGGIIILRTKARGQGHINSEAI